MAGTWVIVISIIQGADNEVVRLHIGQLMPAIGVDSLGLRMPAVRKLADRARYEARQVAYDEARVFASDLDLAGKGEIVAHKHGGNLQRAQPETACHAPL